jgi:hypothetical protein
VWREQGRGVVAVVSGAIGSVVGANIVEVIMDRGLEKGMGWFSGEFSTLTFYGPAALTGQSIHNLIRRIQLN